MGELSWDKLQAADRETVWHPYSSAVNALDAIPVTGAAGVHL